MWTDRIEPPQVGVEQLVLGPDRQSPGHVQVGDGCTFRDIQLVRRRGVALLLHTLRQITLYRRTRQFLGALDTWGLQGEHLVGPQRPALDRMGVNKRGLDFLLGEKDSGLDVRIGTGECEPVVLVGAEVVGEIEQFAYMVVHDTTFTVVLAGDQTKIEALCIGVGGR